LKISRAYKLFVVTITLLLVITGITSFYTLKIQNDIIQSEQHRLRSVLLAYELFQSSEDLTRMARSYVSTGNPIYEEHYYAILDIRNGKRPRPANYDTTYWHLTGAGKDKSVPHEEPVALQELMRREHFTDEEFALLKESQANSDHLVNMEQRAFAAMKGLYDDGRGNYTVNRPPDSAYAVSLLFSEKYSDEKAAIMVPIKQFMHTIDKRTNAKLLSFQSKLRQLIILTTSLISITLLVVLLKTIHTFQSVLHPVKRLLGKVNEIASGNYDARCAVDSSNEIGELCMKFNDMAGALQTDIIMRRQAEEALRESLDTIRGLLDSVDAGVVVVDPVSHVIEQANSHAANLFGAPPREITGHICHQFLCPNEIGCCPITDLGQELESRECVLLRADGSSSFIIKSVKKIRIGGEEKLLETFVDISKRKEAEEQIRYLATHDPMTGLPVMRLAKDFLSLSMRRSRRNKNMTAVMFVDLDGFKAVNDNFGHDAGDYVLQQVANRLISCVRESDTVARVGGDEFLIIADEMHVLQDASKIARKIIDVVSRPIHINGNEAVVGTSIGIALYPSDSDDMDQLIKKADEAMYRIKKAGKNGFGFADQHYRIKPETVLF
jgi:diguanylate cyclase (GGDEF)-like protein/PAS domain S-box-containing protein